MSWLDDVAGFGAAGLIAMVTAPVGVSGAVFLLPVQLSVLGVPSPAVTPTTVEVLGRMRSDRVMRRSTPPRVYDP